MRFTFLSVVDEVLLQASNNAPQLVEFRLQLVDFLLGDVLLRPGDSKQHEEARLLGISFGDEPGS